MFRLSAVEFSRMVSTRRFRRIAAGVLIVALVAVAAFGVRTYRSFVLLQSARDIGAPSTSHIRPWMTLGSVAQTYGMPAATILERLNQPATTPTDVAISRLTGQSGENSILFLQRLQKVLADGLPQNSNAPPAKESDFWSAIADSTLSIVVTFGAPALALTLFLSAAGLPLPSGLIATVAGTLAAQGRLDLASVLLTTLLASLAGDMAGFAIGRYAGLSLLDRYGRYVGLSPKRRAFIADLFDRLGALTILLSRTYVSSMSSVVNILAGAGSYPFGRFLAVAAAGRILWTLAYLGVGYAVGDNAEAASEFLANLTRVLLSIFVCVVCVAALKTARKAG